MKIREKFFGDKRFYGRVAALAIPIILQNGITNLVNMLDNIMVGRLDIASSSGVRGYCALISIGSTSNQFSSFAFSSCSSVSSSCGVLTV